MLSVVKCLMKIFNVVLKIFLRVADDPSADSNFPQSNDLGTIPFILIRIFFHYFIRCFS